MILAWILVGLVVLYLISCLTCGRRTADWYIDERKEIAASDEIVLDEKHLRLVWWVTVFLWPPILILEGITNCAIFRMGL
ncbi:hypothetical protein COU12_00105 [Candidatus Jorgensenbacteria bacterium CG10_big_fil_rev_8_21_14_0_10_54_38]|uniref:Transmembrane protein n=2 Tax=Candidatus Joergenseniibacteriota TaxID=1752739 RepID=A0A2M6WGU2_9BACT|nr:MAG: hypothetical protein COX26_02160 [Candidatus Jorgensenbacteria bacterium CG23_combo_of_CG06-09_8_20_14_all_54_14]PIT91995.1 MAG: hypothetical protein COU12_00105 [Candidatus Jorgensenbacteria bacterium CG10_big_fil_rev_8_21_14_0_10_54_38]